jgi:hypothetical protein
MYDKYFESLKQLLIAKCCTRADEFKGCTPEEIESVMAAQGVTRLPRMFRRYLELMGNSGMNTIYQGSHWRCGSMHNLKRDVIELMEDFDEGVTLPQDAFVFFGHQGCEYRFFLTDNNDDDPPVFRYVEGEPQQITGSLTEYFRPLVLEFIAWLEKGKR